MKNLLPLTTAFILLQCQLALFTLPLKINAQPITLHDATPVKPLTTRTVSSDDAKTPKTADFDVMDEVNKGENVVVPREFGHNREFQIATLFRERKI